MKVAFRIVLLLALAFSMLPTAAFAQVGDAIVGEGGKVALRITASVGWAQSGTCEWRVDDDGVLTIRPLGNGESGVLGEPDEYDEFPWCGDWSIKSIKVQPGVQAGQSLFNFCGYLENLTTADLSNLDTSNTTRMRFMFVNCACLSSVNLNGFDTSNVTDMYGMFHDCSNLTALDISSFDTSHSDTEYMFEYCSNLTSITVGAKFVANPGGDDPIICEFPNLSAESYTGKWISSADGKSYAADEIPNNVAATYTAEKSPSPTQGWNVWGTCEWQIDSAGLLTIRPCNNAAAGVLGEPFIKEGMDGPYASFPWIGSESVTSIKVQEGVQAGKSLRYFCGSLKNLTTADLSNLDTSCTTNMTWMFAWCPSLSSLDLSGFDTSNVTSMGLMFYSSSSLTSIKLGANFTFPKNEYDGNNNVEFPSLSTATYTGKWVSSADGKSYAGNQIPSKVAATYTAERCPDPTEGWNGWGGCEWQIDSAGLLTIRPLKNAATGVLGGRFHYRFPWSEDPVCTTVKSVKVQAGVIVEGDASSFCSGLENVTSVDLSALSASRLTRMDSMFDGCSRLTSINFGSLDTSDVTDMSFMFRGCSSLRSLELSAFDTSKADVYGMFEDCSHLTSLTLGEKVALPKDYEDGEYVSILPRLDKNTYTGKWVSSVDGIAYSEEDIPNNVAATYTAQRNSTPLQDIGFAAMGGLETSYVFSGQSIEPQVSVSLEGVTLTEGSDYEISYADVDAPGTATVTAVGKGSYTGEVSKTFDIVCNHLWVKEGETAPTCTQAGYITYKCSICANVRTEEIDALGHDWGAWVVTKQPSTSEVGEEVRTCQREGCGATETREIAKLDPAPTPNPEPAVDRLFGNTRYTTMSAIADEGFADGSCDVAIFAKGSDFPDALASSALAGAYDAPVILTDTATLSPEAQAELSRLGVNKVYVLGGTSAVSDAVVSSVKGMDISVERVYGDSRQETSVKIYEQMSTQNAACDTVIIASGSSFADALSISPYAYAMKTPILLTDNDKKLTDAEVAAIKNNANIKNVVIVGGNAVVSDDVVIQLGGSNAYAFTRLYGSDRYITSAKIAEWELAHGLNARTISVATGVNFPDALAGAALTGSKSGLLLLVAADQTTQATGVLSANKAAVETLYVYGGTSVVPDAVVATCKEALE